MPTLKTYTFKNVKYPCVVITIQAYSYDLAYKMLDKVTKVGDYEYQ